MEMKDDTQSGAISSSSSTNRMDFVQVPPEWEGLLKKIRADLCDSNLVKDCLLGFSTINFTNAISETTDDDDVVDYVVPRDCNEIKSKSATVLVASSAGEPDDRIDQDQVVVRIGTRSQGGTVDITKVAVRFRHGVVASVLDSGACLSIISTRLARALDRPLVPQREEDAVQVRSANGSITTCRGTMRCKFKIGGGEFSWTFQVLDTLPVDMLIGTDFLTRHGAIIDFGSSSLRLPGCGVTTGISVTTGSAIGKYGLYLTEELLLPPFWASEVSTEIRKNNVPCRLRAAMAEVQEDSMVAKPWVLGRGFCKPDAGTVRVRIANWSDTYVTLRSGDRVGHVTVTEDPNDVLLMDISMDMLHRKKGDKPHSEKKGDNPHSNKKDDDEPVVPKEVLLLRRGDRFYKGNQCSRLPRAEQARVEMSRKLWSCHLE